MFNIKTALLALVISASCVAGNSESAAAKALAAGRRLPVAKVAGSRRNKTQKRRQKQIPAEYQKLAFAEEKPDTFVSDKPHGAGKGAKATSLKQPRKGH